MKPCLEFEKQYHEISMPRRQDFMYAELYAGGNYFTTLQVGSDEYIENIDRYIKDPNIRKVDVFDEDQYLNAVNSVNATRARLERNFELALYRYLGIESHPKRQVLFAIAYDHVRVNGLCAVAAMALELIELLR